MQSQKHKDAIDIKMKELYEHGSDYLNEMNKLLDAALFYKIKQNRIILFLLTEI